MIEADAILKILLVLLLARSASIVYRTKGQPLEPKDWLFVTVVAVLLVIYAVVLAAGPRARTSAATVLLTWGFVTVVAFVVVPHLSRAYSAMAPKERTGVLVNGVAFISLAGSGIAFVPTPRELAGHVVTRTRDAFVEVAQDTLSAIADTQVLPAAPVWNLWVEEPRALSDAPQFMPRRQLETDTEYRVFVDLSALPYGTARTGINTRALSPTFAELLARTPLDAPPSPLQAVLLVDGVHFVHSSGGLMTTSLPLEVANIRAFRDHSPEAVHAPLEALRRDPDSILRFGKAVFPLRTTAIRGRGSIAVSVWANGRPVDEIPASFCIGLACDPAEDAYVSLSGTDSLRVASQRPSPPDLAVHYLSLAPPTSLKAVFHASRDRGRFYVWDVADPARLKTLMQQIVVDATSPNASDAELQVAGERLFKLLFHPQGSPRPDAFRARAILEEAVRAAPPRLQSDEAPSLFARLVETSGEQTLLPLNLMYVGGDFVGFRLRTESPLAAQDYSSPAECVRDWRAVFPPDPAPDNDLHAARSRARELIAGIPSDQQLDLQRLREWLGSGKADAPLTLLILSHHADNRLYFEKANSLQSVHSTDILGAASALPRPSVAILTACGTAAPGATEIIRALSEKGVSSVVATATEVESDMTGDFLDCFQRGLRDAGSRPVALQALYRQSLRCLDGPSDGRPARRYGARILKYQVYGSGQTTLCAPSPPSPKAGPPA